MNTTTGNIGLLGDATSCDPASTSCILPFAGKPVVPVPPNTDSPIFYTLQVKRVTSVDI